jgi:hypothetical protein
MLAFNIRFMSSDVTEAYQTAKLMVNPIPPMHGIPAVDRLGLRS